MVVTADPPKTAVPDGVGVLDDQLALTPQRSPVGLPTVPIQVVVWPNASHGVSAVAERRTTSNLPPSLGKLFLLIGDPKVAPQVGGLYHEFAIAGSARVTRPASR